MSPECSGRLSGADRPPSSSALLEVSPETAGRPEPSGLAAGGAGPRGGTPRLRRADRLQIRMLTAWLDELVPAEHVVRVVWAYVEQRDVSPRLAELRAVEHGAGRDATDPRRRLALGLRATLEGVGAARALDRLCRMHLAYRWILGDVTMNSRTRSGFRVEHEEALDELLTTGVAVLRQQGLVTLHRVAEDGRRVRAAAGASSFPRQATLETHLAEAREQIAALKQELDDPAAGDRRRQAAQERAARERAERLEAALQARDEVEQQQQRGRGSEKQEARGSSTDPEARRLKMPDGGVRPVFNTPWATDVASGLIVGVIVTNQGTDNTGLVPLVEPLEARFGQRPQEHWGDGGFVNREQIEAVAQAGTQVFAPVKAAEKTRAKGQDPFARRQDDTEKVGDWRERRGTQAAKETYQQRASTAKWVNAHFRNCGFDRVTVRGLQQTRCVALWQALAHNLLPAARVLQRAQAKAAEAAAARGSAFAAETVRAQPAGA